MLLRNTAYGIGRPKNRVPAVKNNEISSRVSLREALQRANDVFKKEGKHKLSLYLQNKDLPGHAAIIKTRVSSECYAFDKSLANLSHINHQYSREELVAHNLVFGTHNYNEGYFEIEERNNTKFCFLGFEDNIVNKNSAIPIYGAGAHSKIEIDKSSRNLFFRTITLIDDYKINGHRNRRNITCERHECYNVSFDRSDIDQLFPYSTGKPTKKARGAPQKFSDEEVFAALDQTFSGALSSPKMPELMKFLDQFYAKYENPPVDKTLRRKANKWLDMRSAEKNI